MLNMNADVVLHKFKVSLTCYKGSFTRMNDHDKGC